MMGPDSTQMEINPQQRMTRTQGSTTLMNRIKGTEQTLKMNLLNTWMMLSTTPDKGKSLNSKLSPILYQSSNSIHPELTERRMLPSNTMPKHSTRLKPSLLQRLSEGNTLRLDYNQTIPNLSGMNQGTLMLTKPLMNSFLKSVRTPTNQKGGTPLARPSMTVMQTNLQTKSEESLSPNCLGTTEKRKPGEVETRIAKSLDESCNFLPVITKLSNNGSRTCEQHPSDSLVQSGITLSKDKQSTSVKTKSPAKSDSEHEIVRSYYYMICVLFFQLLPDRS